MAQTGWRSGSTNPSFKALLILCAATIACLVPWINKAFCMDDPLFLWSAAQIQSHPLDFYGCNVNWYATGQPLYDVTKNPPLALLLSGRRGCPVRLERAGPSCRVPFTRHRRNLRNLVFSSHVLPRRRSVPLLLALATPAFIVSSTNVMCDTLMLCLWTWSVALWVKGIQSAANRWLCAASFLMAAAALTKYFAICLIPLLGVYAVLYRRKPVWQLAWLLIPVALLTGYQFATWKMYGRGLLSDAASFAWGIAATAGPGTAAGGRNCWLETSGRALFYRWIVPAGPVLCLVGSCRRKGSQRLQSSDWRSVFGRDTSVRQRC